MNTSEKIPYTILSQDEMHDFAREMSQIVQVRDEKNLNAVVEKTASPEEQTNLESIFYSAIWTLNWHSNTLSHEKIQAIKDMSEELGNQLLGDKINSYQTIYIPLGKFIDDMVKEGEKAQDREKNKHIPFEKE